MELWNQSKYILAEDKDHVFIQHSQRIAAYVLAAQGATVSAAMELTWFHHQQW